MSIKLGKYRYYKGNFYNVIAVAKHSETLKEFVVYEALYDNKVSKFWVRPIELFTDTVEVDGKIVKRYEFVG